MIGPYRLVERIGQGGMGVVYRAVDSVLERPVALKMMHVTADEAPAKAEEIAQRFLREAKAAARIQSRYVAHVLQFGRTDDGTIYIAMELLQGEPLSRVMQRETRLPPARAIRIARQVARGMSVAHALGIVHRDLKPANVMLVTDDDGAEIVKVLDFGVAKLTHDHDSDLTQNGALVGTLPYMAPEQLKSKNIDGRADIYSLGVVLFRMLTGMPLYDAESLSELVHHQIATTPPTPNLRAPDAHVPPDLEAVVMRCLEKDPDKRWQSMLDLEAALAQISGAEASFAPRPLMSTPAPPTKVEETLPTGAGLSDVFTDQHAALTNGISRMETLSGAAVVSGPRGAVAPMPAGADDSRSAALRADSSRTSARRKKNTSAAVPVAAGLGVALLLGLGAFVVLWRTVGAPPPARSPGAAAAAPAPLPTTTTATTAPTTTTEPATLPTTTTAPTTTTEPATLPTTTTAPTTVVDMPEAMPEGAPLDTNVKRASKGKKKAAKSDADKAADAKPVEAPTTTPTEPAPASGFIRVLTKEGG